MSQQVAPRKVQKRIFSTQNPRKHSGLMRTFQASAHNNPMECNVFPAPDRKPAPAIRRVIHTLADAPLEIFPK
jgi:hypothetical protein